jgi:hypothetical protein
VAAFALAFALCACQGEQSAPSAPADVPEVEGELPDRQGGAMPGVAEEEAVPGDEAATQDDMEDDPGAPDDDEDIDEGAAGEDDDGSEPDSDVVEGGEP